MVQILAGYDWLGFAQRSLGFTGISYGGIENFSSPKNFWRGANGIYYNKSWGGNGITGARTPVLKAGAFFRVAGRYLAAGSVGLDYISYNQGRIGFGELASNTSFNVYGIYGGPIGWITSGSYFLVSNTYGPQLTMNLQRSARNRLERGLFKRPHKYRKVRNPCY